MPPRNDDDNRWKIEAFDRRTVETLALLQGEVDELKLWREGIKVKVAFFSAIFGVAGTVGTHYVLKLLHIS